MTSLPFFPWFISLSLFVIILNQVFTRISVWGPSSYKWSFTAASTRCAKRGPVVLLVLTSRLHWACVHHNSLLCLHMTQGLRLQVTKMILPSSSNFIRKPCFVFLCMIILIVLETSGILSKQIFWENWIGKRCSRFAEKVKEQTTQYFGKYINSCSNIIQKKS